MGFNRILQCTFFKKHQDIIQIFRKSKMTRHKFLVSSISHAAISIHRLQFYISKYEWNLLLTTSMFQIGYKIFSEQTRGTRIIILLRDRNDSDLWLSWLDLSLFWLDLWLLCLDIYSEQSWIFVNTYFICRLIISINKNNY